MPANQQQETAQTLTSPTPKATAKYTNKDGSKFITVPKSFNPSDSSETLSPAMAQTTVKPNGDIPTPPPDVNGVVPGVNRKKQKRRQKQAAKLAAEQPADAQSNGTLSSAEVKRQMQELEAKFREHGLDEQYDENGQFDPAEGDTYYSDEDGDAYSGSYGQNGSPSNGYSMPSSNPGKKSKKKKKSKPSQPEFEDHVHGPNGLSLPPLDTNGPRGPGISKEKIWKTSAQEERERIKEFWLSLGEDERKSLVKVEKDAVLKKMKEQQKHSCSCTVCGRKRTAIEEELEVLYDAYYEELEQYANHQGDGGPPPMMAPHRRFGPMSGLQPQNRPLPVFNGQQPSRGRIMEQLGDDEDEEGDEEYSEDDPDEDEYSDEPDELPQSHARDFFNFGNSLTVQGGILTVADDLLKNDGKKFIEMMEQLAERRMAREVDAAQQYSNADYGHPPNGSMHSHSHTHNHPPPPDDEEYEDDEDEEEDEYDSQDEDYDEEEMDTMTEEQRMEEGRRMFQIFAARMFEQRVLTAYKEKVAKERQQKLLEELEEESRANSQKKEKKAKDAQKKKERLQQKKQALAEEKAKREASKAAEEKALRDAEEKKAEEARKRAEEKRKKKEAQKKAEEEERVKREAEKQRRLQEQRERQAELERKQREAKEKERKEKEELRQKEREAKEAKEREAKERKERQEKERKDKEAKAIAEKESKDLSKRDGAAQQATAPANAVAAPPPKRVPVPIPSNLQQNPTAIASPLVQVATPAVPKAPTPIKLRTNSQQDSNDSIPQTPQSSGMSQNVSPVPSTPQHGSPGPIGPPGKMQNQPHLYHPQATSPTHPLVKSPPPGMPFGGMQALGMGFPPGMPMMAPGFGGRMHHEPMFPHQPLPQLRPIPNGIPIHPGFNMHQVPQGRGFPLQHPPPGFSQQIPNNLAGIGQPFQKESGGGPSQTHSRQQSVSYEKPADTSAPGPQAQPIARPAPIGRPSSVVHGNRHGDNHHSEMDDLSSHLGSSALLDDSDEPLTSGAGVRRSSAAPGNVPRQNFAPAPFGMDQPTFGSPMPSFNTWGGPPNPFGTSLPGSNYLGGWGATSPNTSFGGNGPQNVRPTQPRGVAVRLNIYRACKNLEGTTSDGFYDVNAVKDQVAQLSSPGEAPLTDKELLDFCETEGNSMNGGGSFDIRNNGNGQFSIRHEIDLPSSHRPAGGHGEIGSPIVGGGGISRFSGPPPGF